MDSTNPPRGMVRASDGHEAGKVGFIELFFDLVYVFAITQLSHSLLHHYGLPGLAETTFLLIAVWWVWIYTTWAMNWLNPASTWVRLMLFSQMLGGLVLAISIPGAFGDSGLGFAAAYVFMQVSRSVFTMFALRDHGGHSRNFGRISLWMVASGVFWITGAFVAHEARYVVWGIALLIEFAGPIARFWVPGLGLSSLTDWDIKGEHMAERCGLLMIIALGESLLVTGATFVDLPVTPVNVGSLVTAFVGTVAMWWVYFSVAAEHAAHRISQSEDPGRLGRLAYTYLHIPIIAGVILTAVADEIILLHPMGHHGVTASLDAFALCGGPAIFLLGNLLFKRAVFGKFARSHVFGIAALIITGCFYSVLAPLTLAVIATLILIMAGVWEHRAVNRPKAAAA